MVERLKAAIEKARSERVATSPRDAVAIAPALTAAPRPDARPLGPLGTSLPEIALDPEHLRRERVVTFNRAGPAHMAFDVLRTRLMKTCRDHRWSRIGVTSPTKGCGKTVVCANLAFSLARHREASLLLIDLDLRAPRLASVLGFHEERSLGAFLREQVPPERFLLRYGDNLTFGVNTRREVDAAELLHDGRSASVMARTIETLSPDLVIYDLPPLLSADDALAFSPHLDGILVIAAAGQTRADEIEECERLLTDAAPLLGVVLNKHLAQGGEKAYYGYEAS